MDRMFQITMHKTYGSGFDGVVRPQDTREFLAWWNGRSHFPVSQAQPEAPRSLPIAA